MQRKRSEKIFILLIALAVIISVLAAASLVRIIHSTAMDQFNNSSDTAIQLIKERLSIYLPQEVVLTTDEEGAAERDSALYRIITDYEENGSLYSGNLDEVLKAPSPQIFQREIGQRSWSLNLLYDDSTIIASTNPNNIGVRFMLDKAENQIILEQNLNSSYSDRFSFFENIKNLWFNFYMIIPLNMSRGGCLLIQVRHLDIEDFLLSISDRNRDIRIHAYSEDKEIYFTYPEERDRNKLSERIDLPKASLADRTSGTVQIIQPFRNENGISVVGASIWLDFMKLGFILERPTRNIFSPWYVMTGLILLVSLASFLLFFLMMMLLNRKRIEAYDHNPLTHLPGNLRIMEKLQSSISSGRDVMILYCDLDNFKAYNDLYGFSAGDDVITFSAEILIRFFKPSGKVFLGHIGGDDFIVIGPSAMIEERALLFGEAFDREITAFYNDEDRQKGYITSENRQGKKQDFPFVAMSMGGFKLSGRRDIHPLRITEICAEVKKQAKRERGSQLVIDSRESY